MNMSTTLKGRRNRFTKSIDLTPINQTPNLGTQHSVRRRGPSFVPLKDLLSKNHDDRVKDYLDQMKGLSIDDIINNSTVISVKKGRAAETAGGGDVSVSNRSPAHIITEQTKNTVKTIAAAQAAKTKVSQTIKLKTQFENE